MTETTDLSQDVELDLDAQLAADNLDEQYTEQPEIRIAKEQYSVYELLRRVDQRKVMLAPTFQRNDVWDDQQRSEFIESILMGIPIPLIYLFEDETGVRQVVDGRQRITTLKRFLEQKFALSGLIVFSDSNGKTFAELSPLLQGKIEDFQLLTYVIQPPTPEAIKFNIFDRVNRGGTQLNQQEIRHALYQGPATELLKQIADSDSFKLATGGTVDTVHMRDHYITLRFFAFYLYHTGQLVGYLHKGESNELLTITMKALNKKSQSEIECLGAMILRSLGYIHKMFDDEGFRFNTTNKRSPVNMGLFEILVFIFQGIELEQVNNELLITCITQMKGIAGSQGSCGSSFNSKQAFYQRYALAKHAIEGLSNA